MKAAPAVLVTLIVAASLAGCTGSGGGGANPNLLAPKLVVDSGADNAPLVFVHSAFGERQYDRIEVHVNNESRSVRQHAYSFETTLDELSFFLDVRVTSGETRFTFTGTIHMDPTEDQAHVSVLNAEGEWADPRTVELPNERILSRDEEGRAS